MENFTELEQNFITELIDSLYAEPGFSDVSIEDMAEYCETSMNTIRGVAGSLIKKGVIYTVSARELGVYGEDFTSLVYLNENYYHLHPEWKDQI